MFVFCLVVWKKMYKFATVIKNKTELWKNLLHGTLLIRQD